MTACCTVAGTLVPMTVDNMIVRDGVTYQDWPRPWRMRCDTCGDDFEYGTLPPVTKHVATGGDRHICHACKNGGQMNFGLV